GDEATDPSHLVLSSLRFSRLAPKQKRHPGSPGCRRMRYKVGITVLPCSEGDAPVVDVTGVSRPVVVDTQPPGPVARLAGQIHRVRPDDVVRAAAGAVVQDVHTTIGRDQINLQVGAIGMADV